MPKTENNLDKHTILRMLKEAYDAGTVEFSDDDGVFRGNYPGKAGEAFMRNFKHIETED